MDRFLNQFYNACGSTDDIPLFIKTLSKLGIFSPERAKIEAKIKNSSIITQAIRQDQFDISEELIAEYYAMLPEEFWLHSLCSQLCRQHWE